MKASTKSKLPKPDKALETANGWLAPDGSLYPCVWEGHILLARLIIETMFKDDDAGFRNPQLWLEKKGWIKLSTRAYDVQWLIGGYGCDWDPEKATRAQVETIVGWCTKHRTKPPGWMKPRK